MHTNITLKEIPYFLRWKDDSLDIQYEYDTTTADYELSQIYNVQIEEDLNRFQVVDLPSWKVAFTDEITAMQHRVYFYRSTAILLMSLFILIPSVFLYFYQDNLWVLIGGVVYTLLSFFLVESYNQALLNKFQYHLKNHLQLEHLVAAKSIPFEQSDLDMETTPAVVRKDSYPPFKVSKVEKGSVNEVRFTMTEEGIKPFARVTQNLFNTLNQST